jgi:hypothetical protein
MDETPARRLRWLAPLGLAATFAVGWAIGPLWTVQPPAKPPPSPTFAGDDGLPAILLTGTKYTATFTVTIPADWPAEQDDPRGTVALLMVLARGRGEDDPPQQPEWPAVIYCSYGYPHAAGTTITLTCPLTAPDPGPLDLHLSADTTGFLPEQPGVQPKVTGTEHTYHHTVVVKPG